MLMMSLLGMHLSHGMNALFEPYNDTINGILEKLHEI